MTIYDEALRLKEYTVGLRREIHRHPELGWKEYQTQALICRELDSMGIPYERVCETGVIAWLHGNCDYPVIALRADMDALLFDEKTGAEYASETDGIMHACGHDCHVAMLLGAARLIKQHEKELFCTVKLIFQPAEECIEGAYAMCKLPQLEDVDRIFGAHVWIDLPVGTFSVESGPRLASADNIELTIKGKSAHGARPHESVDAIVAACGVVQAIQTVVSRNTDPLEPLVVTFGTIKGGTSSNIIAREVKMTGTVRSFHPEVQNETEKRLKAVAETAAQTYGASCEFSYRRCTPATINEPASTEIAERAVARLFGESSMIHLEKTTGGEDFAWFLERIPGCYLFIGARNEKTGKCWPHHHECFDIDEEALVNGSAVMAQIALCAGAPGESGSDLCR